MWRWDRVGMELHRDTPAETPARTETSARTGTPVVAVAPVIMLMDRRPRVLLLDRSERRAA
jgi:hypothetical protein